jgi:tRNA-specific 2-thiouridylase
LPNKARKDSQGICFLGKIKFSDFIKHHLGIKKGPLVEVETNKPVGEHDGFWYYTIGQRKGIGLSGGPWYVVKKDAEQNIVYISSKYFDPDKKRNNCGVAEFNWIAGVAPEAGEFQVKVRHGEHMHDAQLAYSNEQKTIGTVALATDDQGLSPGQFVVFYDSEVCLGSGVIV